MKKLLTGNEAIARGVYEAGVAFASAYPGTPSTEILENISEHYSKSITCEWAPNEKVAMEAAVGASIAGGRSFAAMKHVGVNVAADPLLTFAYMGVIGGMVLVSADDPSLHSSQNEQDNRYYAQMAKIAMVEPSDSQEAKDMIKAAMEISEQFDTPVLMRTTTRICHSKSIVELEEREERDRIPYVRNLPKNDPVPANCRLMHIKVEERLDKLREYGNTSKLNKVEMNGSKIGVITAGVSYQYAKEVFGEDASYLKLGLTFPLPMELIKDFASKVETLYVVEELEPFMEMQIKAAGIDCIGKDKVPICFELNPDILRKELFGENIQSIDYDKSVVAARPPVLCAGCPHRGFFYELGKLKNVIICSDIGCYGLSANAPLNAKDMALCMGGGFSVAHGAQKLINHYGDSERLVGIMGDSTFFHSGMTSLLECVYNKSNTLLCILDNRITGMTGHQQNPGTGYNIIGEPASETNIEDVVKALGVKNIRIVNPLKLNDMKDALKWGLGFDEPAVIITRWPCVLKRLSKEDLDEFGDYKGKCKVDPDKCIGCKMCMRLGCPAVMFDAEAKKASIDRAQCVACEMCAQVCPKQAISREVR